MTQRVKLKQEFIASTKLFNNYTIESLPQDASSRSYFRIKGQDNSSFMLMDCPDIQQIEPFVFMSNYLNNLGISTPKVYYEDKKNGFLIIEDFGNTSINQHLLKNPSEHGNTYNLIIRLLVNIHSFEPPKQLNYYNKQKLLEESLLFIDWFLPTIVGTPLSPSLKDEYLNIWDKILDNIQETYSHIVLKDFHVDNLMYLDSRQGIQKLGVLDFQDAVCGHPAYDLVSILEDARIDVNPILAKDLLNYYLELKGNLDRKDFLCAYSIFGAQRNLRILGVFARKAAQENNSSYLKYIPRVVQYLKHDISHPMLLLLRNWIEKAIPHGMVLSSSS